MAIEINLRIKASYTAIFLQSPTPAPKKRNAPAMPKIEDEDFVVVCVVAGARASVE